MQTKKNNILQFLVVSLFLVSPFVMSYEDLEKAELISARTLPPFISILSGWYRWGALGLLSIVFLRDIKKIKISKPVYFLSIFYFIQFLYALVDGVDYMRFLFMTLFSLIIPPVIGLIIKQNQNIIKYFIKSIVFFLILSIALNGHLILIGQRFFGFLSNANTYGISTVFWLVILLLASKYELVSKKLFVGVLITLFLTMLFSGSRNAMVGFVLILAFNYYNKFKKISIGLIIFTLTFIVASYFIDLSFVISRFENISNATADSGREDIWELADYAIQQNFWWGNGMDANLLIANTGNMHNSYIRFLLNMGMFFTALTMLMYLFCILALYRKKRKVPLILFGYLLVFAIMNVGEDFFVGLGNSVFVYQLFVFGFINYYITNQHDTSR